MDVVLLVLLAGIVYAAVSLAVWIGVRLILIGVLPERGGKQTPVARLPQSGNRE